MRNYLFFLTASVISSTAAAQDAAPDPAEAVLADIEAKQDARADSAAPGASEAASPPSATPITVTANGLGTALNNTGQAVTILDRTEIEAVQGPDVGRILRRAPGISVTRSGGVGGVSGVNLRGANADQLLVLVDGVRVSDPASPSGGFDFGNLVPGTVGRFDILRGANSTIWGSEAIGGVIDISTRRTGGYSASVEYGTRNTLYADAAGGLEGDRYFVGLAGSYLTTDGFSSVASGSERDGFEQLALNGSAFVDVTNSLELFASASWSEGDLDLDGYPAPEFILADTGDTQETRRHSGAVGLAYYGNDLTLRASFAIADTERENFDADGAETFASDGHSERLALRGEYRLIGGLSVAFGGEHERTNYRTSYDAGADASITGGYVQLGWAMGDLAVHLGSRVDDHARFGTHGSYGADVSYGLGDGWRLRASLGEGFKAPTLFQLHSDYGNPSLVPEMATSFDLGIEHGDRSSPWHFAITGFRRDSEDLIAFLSCYGVTGGLCTDRPFGTYANADRARAQGFEVETGYQLSERLRLSGVYSLVDTENRATGNRLARRPRHFATLYADYTIPEGPRLGVDLRLVGDSFEDAANAIRLDGYEVLDLRASYPLGLGIELFGRVENLFDAEYETVAGYGSPGRGVFVGVRKAL